MRKAEASECNDWRCQCPALSISVQLHGQLALLSQDGAVPGVLPDELRL